MILALRNAPLDRETAPVEGIGVHQNEGITLARDFVVQSYTITRAVRHANLDNNLDLTGRNAYFAAGLMPVILTLNDNVLPASGWLKSIITVFSLIS